MRIIFYVLVAGSSAVVTFLMSWLIWKLSLKYRFYPKIRARDVHTRPTPRLGGVAIFAGILVAFGVASFLPPLGLVFADPRQVLAVLGAALMTVLIGVADDIWDLDWLTKLAGQILAAGLLAWQGVQVVWIPAAVRGADVAVMLSPYQSLALTIFLVVLTMNAVNFIDGLDGLVAGVVFIASAAFFIAGYVYSYGPTEQSSYFNLAQLITATVLGACAGFLPFNIRVSEDRPAKLFAGDGGALVLGLLMAASTVALAGQSETIEQSEGSTFQTIPAFMGILLPLAVLIVPLVDFGFAILRRLRAGKSPFTADRKHLHHRLLDMGHTHVHAVWIFYGWTAAASGGILLFLVAPWWVAVIVMVAGFLICAVVTLAPLSRRKAAEAAVQSAPSDLAADADVAHLDPLDAAAGPVGAEPTSAEADRALERLHEKEAPA